MISGGLEPNGIGPYILKNIYGSEFSNDFIEDLLVELRKNEDSIPLNEALKTLNL